MKNEENLEELEKKKAESRKSSLKDAVFVSATAGFGDSYIPAYGIALGASPTEVGLLTSLPNLFGSIFQALTPKALLRFSRKKIFSLSVLFQSLFWLPIISLSFLFLQDIKYLPLWLVFFYTLYAIFGNFASPAWVSWIGELVPKKEIGSFFGKRNSLGSISALLAMILAGLILDFSKKELTFKEGLFLFGFPIIFFFALIFRLLSRHYVLRQYEPEFKFEKIHYFSFIDFLKSAPKRNFGKFTLFIALILLTTNIIGPFYAIYLLRDLKFSYSQFMLINVFATLATFFFMPHWGKFADRYGNINTLKISGFLVPLICFLWPISIFLDPLLGFYFLLMVNFFSGFAWAGFNLAAGNFIYDATSPEKRGLCLAYNSILNGFGIVMGVALGSFLISHLKIYFMNIIMFVSLISGILRYFLTFSLLPKVREVRVIEHKPSWKAVPLFSQILILPVYIQNIFPLKSLKIPVWKITRQIKFLKRK